MVARYHIHLPAFLPVGPIHPKTGELTHALVEPGELEYKGEPNPLWVCLNDEAVEAMRSVLKKSIEKHEETIKYLDKTSKSYPVHMQKLTSIKRQLEDLKGPGEPPADKAKAEALSRELEMPSMNDMQKGQQLKSGRPSDSPNRR